MLTHYGTEIWHHDGRDPAFRRFNREARHVAFYSRALLERANELEVPAARVIGRLSARGGGVPSRCCRGSARTCARRYTLGGGPLLLNVKRLHPLADQQTLLRAMAEVVRAQRRPRRCSSRAWGNEEARSRRWPARARARRARAFPRSRPKRRGGRCCRAAPISSCCPRCSRPRPRWRWKRWPAGRRSSPPTTRAVSSSARSSATTWGWCRSRTRRPWRGRSSPFSPRRAARVRRATVSSPRSFRLPGVVDRYLALYREAAGA